MLAGFHGVVPREVLTAESGLAFLQGLIDGVHPPPRSRERPGST